jgi:hypothetical protein
MRVRIGGGKTAELESVEEINLDETPIYFEGKRLTEAGAEALAKEILSRRGALGGRPPISPDGVSRIGARVPTPLRDKLREYANAHKVHEADVIRDALAAYLAA